MAVLIFVFALFELLPRLRDLQFDKKYLPLGGILSGFFGGLSGHQGALRSAFLVRAGLTKESFIATGVALACLIDITRLSIYSSHLAISGIRENVLILSVATLCAFAGAYVGNRLVKKVTLRAVQLAVSALLFLVAVLLGSGII